MLNNFVPCRDAFWIFDGAKNDSAPGETFATSRGITQATWDHAVALTIVKGELGNATIADCSAILKGLFWDAIKGDSLPLGIDLMVFNDATLSGDTHAVELLQRIVGTNPDGVIGPITLAAINKLHPVNLIQRISWADDEFLSHLANAPLYINGWRRRERYMQMKAISMVTHPSV